MPRPQHNTSRSRRRAHPKLHAKGPQKRPSSVGAFLVTVISVVCLALSLHLALSYFNFVPNEVRSANHELMQMTRGWSTDLTSQTYQRPPSSGLAAVGTNPVTRLEWPRVDLPQATSTVMAVSAGVQPVRIEIPSVGTNEKIYSPEVTKIDVLNRALRKGVVHYPGSGLLSQKRTVFLFGHSSSLAFVHNKAYQAFNGLGQLSVNDKIYVYGPDKRYMYRVTSSRIAEASEALVDFETGAARLVLSTCNSFGTKTERIVVEATLERVERIVD